MGRLTLTLHIPIEQRPKSFELTQNTSHPHVMTARSIVRNCVWCTLDFETDRCFIPIKLVDKLYKGFGTFCSYNCAYTYLTRDGTGVSNVATSLTLLHDMYKHDYGTYTTFKTMPHRIALAKYNEGNGITKEEFVQNITVRGTCVITKYPEPFIEPVESDMRITNYGSFSVKRRV